jgi:hypothetical protein
VGNAEHRGRGNSDVVITWVAIDTPRQVIGLCCFTWTISWTMTLCLLFTVCCGASPVQAAPAAENVQPQADVIPVYSPLAEVEAGLLLLGLGDSLTQGTMAGTNNATNTLHAYLQNIAASLAQVSPITFSQPLFNVQEKRLGPFRIPINLGVDGADVFSLDGFEYYKRAGVEESFRTDAYLCDRLLLPFDNTYDKVLYPINVQARQPVSQIDAAVWHLDRLSQMADGRQALVIFWAGNNYALLHSGYSVDYVNEVLEVDGQQHDDLVLSEAEQGFIRARIDGFNSTIKAAANARGPYVQLVDIGQYLNDVLTGTTPVIVDGRVFSRKWIRGNSFTFDGVHPGYTGQAFSANVVLTRINAALGLQAPFYDLAAMLAQDPYIDRDGDGWAPGPAYTATGLTELLSLFKAPDDHDPAVQPELPADVWTRMSQILLGELLGITAPRQTAERLGVSPARSGEEDAGVRHQE